MKSKRKNSGGPSQLRKKVMEKYSMDGYAKKFSSCSGDGQQLQHIRQQQQQNQIFSSPTNCLADENLHIDYIILHF